MRKTLLTVLLTGFFAGTFSPQANAFIQTVMATANNTFSPSSFTINVGDTVLWQYQGGANHTTTSTTIPGGATPWNANLTPTSITFQYKATVAGTYNYVCTPHAPGMAGTFTVVACTAPTTPVITATPSGATACQGSSVTLTIPVQSSALYQWFLNGNPLGTGTSNSIVTPNAGVYTVSVTNNCGSVTSAPISVTINPIPASGFTFTLTTGKTYGFNATNTASGNTYLWNFGDPASGANNTSSLAAPSHTFSSGGKKYVSLKVTSSAGCNSTSIDSIQVPTSVATIGGREVFTISPNPANNQLLVHTSSTDAVMSLLDYSGRLLTVLSPVAKTSGDLYFDVREIPAGSYLLQIRTASGTAVEKIQILH